MKFLGCRFTVGLLLLIASTSSMASEVLKADWITAMTSAIPAYFCKSDQYFRQCFKVTQVECEEAALSTTRICLAQYKDNIPASLRQPEDRQKWGATIGSCAGSA